MDIVKVMRPILWKFFGIRRKPLYSPPCSRDPKMPSVR